MSTHVIPVIQIEQILPHPNADQLELVPVGGWHCAVRKGDFKVGDRAIYIEPDYTVPVTRPEFAFLKDPSKFGQTHTRIRAKRLRGEMSFGLLIPVPVDHTGDYIYSVGDNVIEEMGITRWQPPEVSSMRTGFNMAHSSVPTHLLQVGKFDLENLNNYGHLLDLGNEDVVVTEKIHGSNARYCFADGQFFAGSRSHWLRRPTDEELATGHKLDAWNRVADEDPSIQAWCEANPDVILYGEIFGNVQDLKYGRPNCIEFAGFAAYDTKTGHWIDTLPLFASLRDYDVTHVPIIFSGKITRETLDKVVEHSSTVAGAPKDHMREGVVISPVHERRDPRHGRVSLKLISNRYWTRKL